MANNFSATCMNYQADRVNQFNDLIFNSSLPEELKFYVAAGDTRFGEPTFYCMCEYGGELVGGLAYNKMLDDHQLIFEIASIYIHEPHRRKKGASTLLTELETLAKSDGANKIRLVTDPQFEGAKECMEKNGYIYRPDENFLIMEKKI